MLQYTGTAGDSMSNKCEAMYCEEVLDNVCTLLTECLIQRHVLHAAVSRHKQ